MQLPSTVVSTTSVSPLTRVSPCATVTRRSPSRSVSALMRGTPAVDLDGVPES